MSLRTRVLEDDGALHSGVRTKSLTNILARDLTKIAAAALMVETSAWLALPVTSARFFAQTPVLHIDQSGGAPVTGQVRFRVIGYTRFGEQVQLTTPWGSITAVNSNFLYLSTAFHIVLSVEYQCVAPGLDFLTTLSCGVFPNFARVEDATNHYVWGDNMGIGLPLRPGLLPRAKFTKGVDGLGGQHSVEAIAADSYASEAPFDVIAFSVFNHTTGVIWRTQDNIVVGRVASGFAPEPNKVTIETFGSVVNEVGGGAVTQAVTDALQVSIVMHTSKTKIAGSRLNDLPA